MRSLCEVQFVNEGENEVCTCIGRIVGICYDEKFDDYEYKIEFKDDNNVYYYPENKVRVLTED